MYGLKEIGFIEDVMSDQEWCDIAENLMEKNGGDNLDVFIVKKCGLEPLLPLLLCL